VDPASTWGSVFAAGAPGLYQSEKPWPQLATLRLRTGGQGIGFAAAAAPVYFPNTLILLAAKARPSVEKLLPRFDDARFAKTQ